MEKKITVQCYAGFKGDERPTSFSLEGRTVALLEIADRWYDPEYNYFRVVAGDGESHLLRHDLNADSWALLEKDEREPD